MNFLHTCTEPKDFDPSTCCAPAWHLHARRYATEHGSRKNPCFFDTTLKNICHLIKKTPPGKVRDILLACYRYKEGKGIRSIARELKARFYGLGLAPQMGWRGLDGRFDLKSTSRKKVPGMGILKKIRGWIGVVHILIIPLYFTLFLVYFGTPNLDSEGSFGVDRFTISRF